MQNETGKLTWHEIKLKIFPGKPVVYDYSVRKTRVAGKQETQYVFHKPQPKLSLRLDTSGSYFHISDIKPINDMLKHLNLPEVEQAVPELASITHARKEIN